MCFMRTSPSCCMQCLEEGSTRPVRYSQHTTHSGAQLVKQFTALGLLLCSQGSTIGLLS
jgi:hypothetical protein